MPSNKKYRYPETEKQWRLAHPENVKKYYQTQNKKRYAWNKISLIFRKILL